MSRCGRRRRGSSHLVALCLLFACLTFACLWAPLPASAQADRDIGVLVVNQERVLLEAAAAQAITREEQIRKAAMRAAFDAERAALQGREREMIGLRETIDKEEFDALVAGFELDVRDLRSRMDRSRADMQTAFNQAKDMVARALQQVLVDLMKERGALLIIDESTSILHASRLDVTDEVIARLDAVLPAVQIRPTDMGEPDEP